MGPQARNTTAAVDVVCSRYIYSVGVRADGSLRQTDILGRSQLDRFGRWVRWYDSNCAVGCVARPGPASQIGLASPAGKYVYAIYAKPEMMIFERFGRL